MRWLLLFFRWVLLTFESSHYFALVSQYLSLLLSVKKLLRLKQTTLNDHLFLLQMRLQATSEIITTPHQHPACHFRFEISDPPGPATLVFEPKKVVKKGSVRLSCSVKDYGRPPSSTFRWVRGSHLIQDVTSSNWTIDPVTLETKANFTCSAYNLGGEGDGASVFVDVFGMDFFIFSERRH